LNFYALCKYKLPFSGCCKFPFHKCNTISSVGNTVEGLNDLYTKSHFFTINSVGGMFFLMKKVDIAEILSSYSFLFKVLADGIKFETQYTR
jgi:hypothetical protein